MGERSQRTGGTPRPRGGPREGSAFGAGVEDAFGFAFEAGDGAGFDEADFGADEDGVFEGAGDGGDEVLLVGHLVEEGGVVGFDLDFELVHGAGAGDDDLVVGGEAGDGEEGGFDLLREDVPIPTECGTREASSSSNRKRR